MISLWLRCTLAALTIALLAQYRASHPAVGAAYAIGVFLALHSAIVAASFAISRRHAFEAPPQLVPDFHTALLIVLREWLAYLALFVLIQPFDRLWMGKDATGRPPSGRVPVLLIHGYMCNRGTWWWLHRKLMAAGFVIGTINLKPPLGGIDAFAAQLHARVEALCAETGAKQLVLVGHSMGGLVARAYLRQNGAARVAKLVTLASPHHGTWLARYGLGRNAREMRPGSGWIRALEASDPGVPMLSIWTPTDNFVAPQDSSRLAGAREQIVPALSHLAMLFSPLVLEILIGELAHPDLAHK